MYYSTEKKYVNTQLFSIGIGKSELFVYDFSDIGLRNARINFRQQEVTHLMGNMVYNELRVRGLAVDVGVVVLNTKNE